MSTARWATMFVIIWGFVGFYMVLFIAAIKGVPAEIYEAARIDGAGRCRMSTSVTIPMIRDAVQTAYIYLGILALDAFVYMQALNPDGRAGQLDAGDEPEAVPHRVHRWQGRPARARWASSSPIVTLVFAVHRLHRQPAHRRQGPDRDGVMTTATPAAVRDSPPARDDDPASGGDRAVTVDVAHVVLVVWSVIVVAPLAWTLLSSFKTTREIFASPFSLPGRLELRQLPHGVDRGTVRQLLPEHGRHRR